MTLIIDAFILLVDFTTRAAPLFHKAPPGNYVILILAETTKLPLKLVKDVLQIRLT